MTSKQDVFEKIDFERQWLKAAGLSEYNLDTAFDSIKIAVDLMVKALEQKPIILKANEKQLEELIHDNLLCVAMAEPKTDVLDKIRAEIDQYLFQNEFGSAYRKEVSQIIDKYRQEGI